MMEKLKKVLAFALAVLTVAALSACGGGLAAESQGAEPPEGQSPISSWPKQFGISWKRSAGST